MCNRETRSRFNYSWNRKWTCNLIYLQCFVYPENYNADTQALNMECLASVCYLHDVIQPKACDVAHKAVYTCWVVSGGLLRLLRTCIRLRFLAERNAINFGLTCEAKFTPMWILRESLPTFAVSYRVLAPGPGQIISVQVSSLKLNRSAFLTPIMR